jgi:2-polyprenyl-3-methyl-5-hydroxy-6-metoxy-1,4-benzoquinol methylase
MPDVLESVAAVSRAWDESRSQAFAERLVGAIDQTALTMMTSLGHRTGLFDTMSHLVEPATSTEIALTAGLNERYVREWLGAMVTGGVVDHDPVALTYVLPREHAAWLTRAASPNNIAVTTQWVAVLAGVEEQVVDAFSHGRGVPYSAYGRFHQVMAEESAQTTVAALVPHILPLVPDLVARLTSGIRVLDVGCGSGAAMVELAAAFPASTFTGYDFSREAIDAAEATARQRELRNVRFVTADAADLAESNAYDLITAFDAIHDQARPAEVLRRIAGALRRPSGIFLMQDIAAHTAHHDNIGQPLGTFTYAISCMHCMSVSLAGNGAGLGAAWGREKAIEMLGQAGFGRVRVEKLPHDIINEYYIVQLPV